MRNATCAATQTSKVPNAVALFIFSSVVLPLETVGMQEV